MIDPIFFTPELELTLTKMHNSVKNAVLPHAWPDRSTGAAQLACDGRQIRDTEPAPPPCNHDSWGPVLAEYDEHRHNLDDLCKRLHGLAESDNRFTDYAADALALVRHADEIRDMLGTAVES